MAGMMTLKTSARACARRVWYSCGLPPPPNRRNPMQTFVCNVCGTPNTLPRERLTREDGHCSACQCYGRLRSIVYAVMKQFSPGEPILARMEPRKDIRGIGCSDWGYTDYFAEKFDYTNTFYDEAPQLDLCQVDWSRWPRNSFDFITSTDVLEHVAPPVETAFQNMYDLLKPGGVTILTVPMNLDRATREHFPNLHDWRIETTESGHVLVNQRTDGAVERFDQLCFHGGKGLTLEFRFFSRRGLIRTINRAGFRIATIYEKTIGPYAIPLIRNNIVVVAEKPQTRKRRSLAFWRR
jgi:SAM-dependent methyltransferase